MSNLSIPVTLENQISVKTGHSFVCVVVDLGYTKKRIAFGRDALDIFNLSPRDIDLSVSPCVISRGTLSFD